MPTTASSSHAGDGGVEATWPLRDVDVESCRRWCCRVMMTMALQLKVVLAVVRLRSPRAHSIEVLSQCEEVRLICQSSMIFMLARSRMITGKIS
jgi:hypothetical protein